MFDIGRFLFGQDVFIAYSQRDARAYAFELSNRLSKRGYASGPLPDQLPFGLDLASKWRKVLRQSSMMVVLGTPGAAGSEFVRLEIQEFLKLGRPVVPIDIDYGLRDASWFPLVAGSVVVTETREALEQAAPSEAVIYQIDRGFTFLQRQKRQRTFALATSALIALIIFASYAMVFSTQRRLAASLREAADAKAEVAILRKQLEGLQSLPSGVEHTVPPQDMTATGQKMRATAASDGSAKSKSTPPAQKAKLNGKQQTSAGKGQGLSGSVLTALAVVGALFAYAAGCAALLFLRPLWILSLHAKLSLESIVGVIDPSGVYGRLGKLLLVVIGADYFAKHRRTRQEWLTHYRLGRSKLSDLSSSIRSSYIKNEDCLDAWTTTRRERALLSLERTPFLAQRSLFIPLPVQEDKPAGRLLLQPTSTDFGYLFASDVTLIQIVGPGGSGKSTFAAQLARWGLEPTSARRLTPQYMIPVFIQEDASDIIASVAGHLRQMLGPDDLERDLIVELLRRKRVLVIIDGLSERSRETQVAIARMFQAAELGAVVITARHNYDFGPTPTSTLRPQNIADRLYYFLAEYLRLTDARETLSGKQAKGVSDRVIALFEQRSSRLPITPLIVKLIVDQAVELQRQNLSMIELSGSVANAIIDYLKRVNPSDDHAENSVSDDVIIAGARMLAECGLRESFTPHDFFKEDAIRALEATRDGERSHSIVSRLVDNGVIEERVRGGTSFLRFGLDPVAEYLAVMYWLDRFRSNEGEWLAWMTAVESATGYPESMEGLLAALEECLESYSPHFYVPGLVLSWARNRPIRKLSESTYSSR
jgi:hypothetical protein